MVATTLYHPTGSCCFPFFFHLLRQSKRIAACAAGSDRFSEISLSFSHTLALSVVNEHALVPSAATRHKSQSQRVLSSSRFRIGRSRVSVQSFPSGNGFDIKCQTGSSVVFIHAHSFAHRTCAKRASNNKIK